MFWGRFSEEQAADNKLKNHAEAIEMPKGEMYLASCMNILRNVYGYVFSVEKGVAVDKSGGYLPLYTYPTIEYLTQFDFRKKRVFEFGAGASTFFWMERAAEVVSVENNQDWYTKLKSQIKPNVQLIFAENRDFPLTISKLDGVFDIIIVDGFGYRYDSAVQALNKLAPGGCIVLDNADWHPNTAALLKSAGLLQVDMTGFKPCESHTSTTSIFFRRDFDFETLEKRQPVYGKGSKWINSAEWDKAVL